MGLLTNFAFYAIIQPVRQEFTTTSKGCAVKGLFVYVVGLWVLYITGMVLIATYWHIHNSWSGEYHGVLIVVILAATATITATTWILQGMYPKSGSIEQGSGYHHIN